MGYCKHKEHRASSSKRLYSEALVVGAALVPVWFAVSKATEAARFEFAAKSALDVFVAGFLFHLIAEETGVNDWYLTNSHAAQKVLSYSIGLPDERTKHHTMDWASIGAVVNRY